MTFKSYLVIGCRFYVWICFFIVYDIWGHENKLVIGNLVLQEDSQQIPLLISPETKCLSEW